jgi:hypothetical protein
VANNAFLSNRSELIAALALRYVVPTISSWREFTAAGGLMSYGGSLDDNLHLVGNYTGRILKGERLGRAAQVNVIVSIYYVFASGACPINVQYTCVDRHIQFEGSRPRRTRRAARDTRSAGQTRTLSRVAGRAFHARLALNWRH